VQGDVTHGEISHAAAIRDYAVIIDADGAMNH
jgi:hypothetical protein